MLVTFLGSPSSGKTTTAAKVFAELKLAGMPVEFVAEQARQYIAKKRVLYIGKPVVLNDDDQNTIFFDQANIEQTMLTATAPNGIVVSDSSALNSLFYMTPEYLKEFMQTDLYKITMSHYQSSDSLIFYCAPIQATPTLDPNRIHNSEQAAKIDEDMRVALKNADYLTVTELIGPVNMRSNDVLRSIYQKVTNAKNP